jgi:hypothetical protein
MLLVVISVNQGSIRFISMAPINVYRIVHHMGHTTLIMLTIDANNAMSIAKNVIIRANAIIAMVSIHLILVRVCVYVRLSIK